MTFLDNKRSRFWALNILIIVIIFGIYSSVNKDDKSSDLEDSSGFLISQGNTLLPLSNPANPPLKVVGKLSAVVTAYSSTPGQTDDTPHITAAGTYVREGIVANNFLSFGTEIRIPEVYKDKVFVVEDRMSWKKGNNHVDVWFPDYGQALAFGAKTTYIEILGR
jgi:3D (Asp-Asp-Asp) domain-containing protein